MYQSVLVHHAETHRYRPGQEDTMLRVLSSVSTDAGIYQVIHEPQADPAAYQVQTDGARTWLLGWLRRSAAVLLIAVRRWATGNKGQPVSEEARGLLGEAPRYVHAGREHRH